MSWNPSLKVGALYRDANPENAMPGNIDRSSGLKRDLFNALTASLCLHTAGGVSKHTHRIGTSNFLASSTHLPLVSGSAFVLSINVRRADCTGQGATDQQPQSALLINDPLRL